MSSSSSSSYLGRTTVTSTSSSSSSTSGDEEGESAGLFGRTEIPSSSQTSQTSEDLQSNSDTEDQLPLLSSPPPVSLTSVEEGAAEIVEKQLLTASQGDHNNSNDGCSNESHTHHPTPPSTTGHDAGDTTTEPSEAGSGEGPVEGGRKYDFEDSTMDSWKGHGKHVFVLTESGKPIYSRYGSEIKLGGLTGVLATIVSFALHDEDVIRTIEFGEHLITFIVRGPLYLVSVSQTGEPHSVIVKNLEYVYNQILSILTGRIVQMLSDNPKLDVRHLLGGCENILDGITTMMGLDLGLSCDAIQCLRFPKERRQAIGNIIQSKRCPNMLFGIMFCRSQLIQLVRPRKLIIVPSDLHLIFNFINSSSSFRTSESWTPICLPQFNSTGYLYAYVCFLSEFVCLVLISAKADSFYDLKNCKRDIVHALEASQLDRSLNEAVQKRSSYLVSDIPFSGSVTPLHFVYISLLTRQITYPAMQTPYCTTAERKRLFRAYQNIHNQVATQKQRVHFYVSQYESILALSTPTCKLYTTFGPLELKANALQTASILLRWIKQEGTSLFILNSPVF